MDTQEKPMKKIPLIKPWIEEEEYLAVKEVLDSGYLTDGPVTREFEKEFSKYVSKRYAVATTSCATAMDLALRVLGIKPGDEVIIPDYTHPATADVVKLVGASPVLVDVDPKTYNVTLDNIKKAISKKTRCIMPVSLFGQPLDMKPIMELAEKHNLFVVEDAACSAGAMFEDVKEGSLPHIACYSFHPRKVITTGEGGMLVTDNEEWANLAKSMKHFGATGTVPGTSILKFENLGTNYKLTNIQSAIGRVQLRRIEKIIAMRIEKARIYNNLLKDVKLVTPPFVPKNVRHTFQAYCTLLDPSVDRDEVIRQMNARNIETQIGSYCLHIQPAFAKERRVGDLKNAESVYNRALVLPIYRDLTEEQQRFIVKNLKEVVEMCRRKV